MDKKKIYYIIRDAILGNLINNSYVTSEEVVDWICEIMPEDNEDRDDVIDLIFNDTSYNYITSKNGEGYIFGLKEKDIKDFIADADFLSDDDPCWREPVRVKIDGCYNYGWSQLNEFVED